MPATTDFLVPSGPPQESASETAAALFTAALATQLPVAVWRLPSDSQIQAVVSAELEYALPPLEGPASGFAFCPFQESAAAPSLFLPADLYFSGREGEIPLKGKQQLPPRFWVNFEKTGLKQPVETTQPSHANGTARFTTRDAFEVSVAAAIKAMETGELEKVVLSRTKTLPLFEGFDLWQSFLHLTKLYPTAFVSLVAIPGVGTWLGATPELLVQIDKNHVFRTVALAGTQPLTEGLTPAEAIWRQKEIEEQALVQRYVIHCFKQLRLRDYLELGPKTMVAGNLLHLRTEYSANMETLGFPDLGSQMLRLLHPTSAVGGMPKAAALQLIAQLEQHERRYFSGFLGPVHIEKETYLCVNLRCVEIGLDTVTAYAGAGLTPDSVPAKEWEETELKMQTVLRLFQACES